MNKKLTALCLSCSVLSSAITGFCTYEQNKFSTLDANSEHGYIFMVKDSPFSLFSVNDAENIDVISEELNMYHADTLEELNELSQKFDIKLVAEDVPVELFGDSGANDEYYASQWSHTGVHIPHYWINDITGENIRIGVVDTGINRNHEDFNDVDIAEGINVCALLDKDEESYYDTSDTHGHGTGVMSVVCAKRNNYKGIAGIVDDCTLVPIRVYDTTSDYNLSASSVLTGMQQAYKQGCDVINLSLGFKNPSDELIELTNTLTDALAEEGVIVIAATGNDGKTTNALQYPASCENVIGVGSVGKGTDGFVRSSFSTANASVFISAPGEGIWTLSNLDETSYQCKDGTSFASPIVAAAAVGAKQINPDITVSEFKEYLKETSVDIGTEGYDENTGYGVIDFGGLYEKITLSSISTPEPTQTPEITASPKPTAEATTKPTEEPTPTPSEMPTISPEPIFTQNPTTNPIETVEPSFEPIMTEIPTQEPTEAPIVTVEPTVIPTIEPTVEPTITPTVNPTSSPEPKEEFEVSFGYSEEDNVIELCLANNTGSELKLSELVAVYDEEGNLVQIKHIDTLYKGDNNLLFVPRTEKGTLKLFLWDDISSMKPYKGFKAHEFSFGKEGLYD